MCPLTCTFVAYRTDGSLSKGHSVDNIIIVYYLPFVVDLTQIPEPMTIPLCLTLRVSL